MTTATSDPALGVLNRALQGDQGALSFLDRTLSIYVLDATDSSKPKTYGSWNFIHQAMNEVERHEARSNGSSSSQLLLHSHVQLLATIAKRVARKSPAADRQLVETCIANANYSATAQQSQSLVDINYELREIVMGRIAAVCFDFAFHRPNSTSSYKFAMESLCAVLSANAVSSGPSAVQHLMVEWIVPSRATLPPLAVTCVALHLATEARRSTTAPAGTKDALQRLSAPTIGLVVVPVLVQAMQEQQHSNHALVATCIRALERWFVATDLSLPQARHLVKKVGIDLCQVMADILYSDNAMVVDTMAEWMEVALLNTKMSFSRMVQARHLMQVDEASFQQSISEQELERIEEKEMALILQELMSAIALQRFRFVERQARADHGVCRNLTRIAASICKSLGVANIQEGMVDLLLKAAAHPMVHVCSIALDILARVVMVDSTFSFRLLPVLQHRAIVPHMLNMGVPSLSGSATTSGVEFGEFENFRQVHLVDALMACFRQNPDYYMDSCTSAIEEFCGAPPNHNAEVCFQLEAALYCLVAVADEALQQDNTQDPLATDQKTHDAQLQRCAVAITSSSRPCASNPLTLAQQCRFLGAYAGWFATHEAALLNSAAEVALATFNMANTPFANNAMIREMSTSPFAAAALALERILTQSPQYFTTIAAITALGGAWEGSFVATNQGKVITIEDRKVLCRGICCALASLPQDQRSKSLLALSLPAVDCLDRMTKLANERRAQQHPGLESALVRVADEVQILSTMASSFHNYVSNSTQSTMASGCVTGADGSSKNPSLEVLRRSWPYITHLARTFYAHERLAGALGEFLCLALPHDVNDDEDFLLLKDLCELACAILKSIPVDNMSPRPAYGFVEEVIAVYGSRVERSASNHASTNNSSNGREEEVGRLVERLLLTSVEAARASLWTTQTQGKEQGQGQQPFECKTEPRPVTREREKSTDALSGLFSILAVCTQECPFFFVRLPADSDDDMLAVQSVEAAVAALVETQDEVSRSAMKFLTAAVELYESSVAGGENGTQTVRQVMEGALQRTRRSIIMMLIAGACGSFAHVTLEPAAVLLSAVLKSLPADDAEPLLVDALAQEQFLLGDDARLTSLAVFRRCASGEAPQALMIQALADLWALHQTDEAGAIAGGDAVLRFVHTYST